MPKLVALMCPGQMVVEIGNLIFLYEGGQYIDVAVRRDDGNVFMSEECINVHSMDGEKRIPQNDYNAFINECVSWINSREI